jgi:rhodanese-related sulfurtransferase
MLNRSRSIIGAVLLLALPLGACSTGPAVVQTTSAKAEDAVDRSQWYRDIVDIDFVRQYAVTPPPEGVVIVDSRPPRLYDPGHIPTAINIPDTQFDRHVHLLPEDRSTLLLLYCNGVKCPLSHDSARRAEALGYTNIKVYAAGFPDWEKAGELVSVSAAHVHKLIESADPTLIVDSRPAKRKYDLGHIPTAINIPDSQFDSLRHLLPAEKAAPILFYCDGFKCPLSAGSATKAKALGYTNVKTFTGGYPGWVAAYGSGEVKVAAPEAAPAAAPVARAVLEQGKEQGTITVAAFERLIAQGGESALIVDVRNSVEFDKGSLKGAINIPIGELEGKLDTLPRDRPVVFFCSTGGRSGEAYDMVKLLDEGVAAYFVDAGVSVRADGTYHID